MPEPERKILDLDALVAVREELRREGRRVVQCHGCFDIVHPGHIRYLRFAAEQGDVLVVSLSSDDVVGKGYDRPYIHQDLRLENLAALEIVDYVVLDHHDWAGPVLEAIRPDVYVKGKEYETNRDPRFLREQALVESYGGQVIFSSGDVVFSSTRIISMYREKMDLDAERVSSFRRQHGIDGPGLESALVSFQGRHVVVVGDPVLDLYVQCDTPGVAAEAPVLTVTPVQEHHFVGGGGLVASQLALLGAQVTFITAVGEEPDAAEFERGLRRHGVRVVVVHAARRPLYRKRRYLVNGQKVFKVEEGLHSPLSTESEHRVAEAIHEALEGSPEGTSRGADGLVVTDFGYGFFGEALCAKLRAAAEDQGVPVYVDVSGRGPATLLRMSGARLATPTEDELRFALGDPESGLSNLAARYFTITQTERLLLTLGQRGCIQFFRRRKGERRLRTEYLPALGLTQAVDAVGAGDVFLSGALAADLAGAPAAHGIYLGSALAALHIARLGNDPVRLLDLQHYLRSLGEVEP